MLHVKVLGSAAGGGFPQWNSAGPGCRRARDGDPAARRRTQTSLAVSADGAAWVLLNASPDLRAQLEATPALNPRPAEGQVRHSPIVAVVLTGAEIDTIAGLLTLREGHAFELHATQAALDILAANPVFDVLPCARVPRRALEAGKTIALAGLEIEAMAVPGKAPLFLNGGHVETTIGLRIAAGGGELFFIPGCAAMTSALAARLKGAGCVMFDGTLWRDDEMIRAGAGPKTGRDMGHMSLSGPEGTLAAFADIAARRRILIHLNNTNPVLLSDSAERAAVAMAGWEVAEDGMEFTL